MCHNQKTDNCNAIKHLMKMYNINMQDIIEHLTEEMCDKYCKFPDMIEDVDYLLEHYCENCPFVNLF